MASAGWAMEEENYEGLRATVQEVSGHGCLTGAHHRTPSPVRESLTTTLSFCPRAGPRKDGFTSGRHCMTLW